eukprot:TRINITY_DN23156_c0_g1_i1.p1 TRINITY_DN23156_c0_g1~~TRINITY_DN23156_c0_g1_i1.p1  ORF type:complete len:280 (+),score=100.13 TRINITY_DN23156_c0_g1_i1:50-889(+)
MIQVDVFWSFALGGSFACFAGDALAKYASPYENWYFAYTLMFLSMVFAPSGVFLLNLNPSWESMFVYQRSDFGQRGWQDALIPTIFGWSNVALGVIGFIVNWYLLRQGRRQLATYLHLTAYMCMFSILGFGYGRFLYAGDGEDWLARKEYHILDFIGGQIFWALVGLGAFVGPAFYPPWVNWQSQNTEAALAEDRATLFKTFAANFAVIIVGYQAYLQHYGEAEKQRILTGFGVRHWHEAEFGVQSPLVVCIVMNIACAVVFIAPPLFLVPGKRKAKKH